MNIKNHLYQQIDNMSLEAVNYLKVYFLFHSNKISGSQFTQEELKHLVFNNIIIGAHYYEDIIETQNTITAFDYLYRTLGEPITLNYIINLYQLLTYNTSIHDKNMKLHNLYSLLNKQFIIDDFPITEDDKEEIEDLIEYWEFTGSTLEEITIFHSKWINLKCFGKTNSQIARMIMLKQCIECGVKMVIVRCDHKEEYLSLLNYSAKHNDYQKLYKFLQDQQIKTKQIFLQYMNN